MKNIKLPFEFSNEFEYTVYLRKFLVESPEDFAHFRGTLEKYSEEIFNKTEDQQSADLVMDLKFACLSSYMIGLCAGLDSVRKH
ncbi:MAG TPA: hypothetical protein VM577_21375 [Anaerovoracaceae bacterium]|nr:hypothetical protein [Anaerovoracaceae bacterium]